MKSSGLFLLYVACFACVALSSCSGPAGDSGSNPPKLFLATDGSELKLRLVPVEPEPF
jgi:hypothetical protein